MSWSLIPKLASPRISVFITIDSAEQEESLRICLELLPAGNYKNDTMLTTLHHFHFIVCCNSRIKYWNGDKNTIILTWYIQYGINNVFPPFYRWRVFRSVFLLPPDTVELVVFTSLCLHNYLRQSPSCTTYCPVGLVDSEQNGEVIPGSWRQESATEAFSPLAVPSTGHNATTDAKGMRKTFKDYFFDEGSVDWQWDMC